LPTCCFVDPGSRRRRPGRGAAVKNRAIASTYSFQSDRVAQERGCRYFTFGIDVIAIRNPDAVSAPAADDIVSRAALRGNG
jgi:hypothetical protein